MDEARQEFYATRDDRVSIGIGPIAIRLAMPRPLSPRSTPPPHPLGHGLYVTGLIAMRALAFEDVPRVLSAGVPCTCGTLNDIRVGQRGANSG